MTSLIVSVPSAQLADDVRALLDPALDIDVVVWDDAAHPPRAQIDMVVPPYMRQGKALDRTADLGCRLIQGQSIGYDGVEERLPRGMVFANASSVHETATAELAVSLLLVAQRELDRIARDQTRAVWDNHMTAGLADRRVLLLGYGGVGKAIARRLDGFEVDLVPVASRARDEDGVHVHGIDELPALLPTVDILLNALPGGATTKHLIDDDALSALPDGALVSSVGRGSTIDTDAIVQHVRRGRLRFASDVFDPEPLPEDHPLWTLDGVYITPHIGGNSQAMRPRVARLVAGQAERLARGEEPINVVLRT